MMLDAQARDRVLSMPPRRFAVVDGALFDDLPARLSRASLEAMSLFRDHPSKDAEREGPWLVLLPDEMALDSLSKLARHADQPWGVFWSCTRSVEAFARHLRSLNLVLLPNAETGQHETVMFRHWDPTALALVMNVLDPEQLVELVGPAHSLVVPRFGESALVIESGKLPAGAAHG